MPSFRDLDEVAAHLSDLDLPFTWYVMGPDGHAITFEVTPRDVTTASEYFAHHPLALADGTPVEVLVGARRGECWTVEPPEGAGRPDDQLDHAQLVGLDVDDAAALASSAGWLVRAQEPEAIVTADHRANRLNLVYGDDRVVESVAVG